VATNEFSDTMRLCAKAGNFVSIAAVLAKLLRRKLGC
jgi:hypothetical protein